MNVDEGLAQAVPAERPNKERWSGAEPWGSRVGHHTLVYVDAHRNTCYGFGKENRK